MQKDMQILIDKITYQIKDATKQVRYIEDPAMLREMKKKAEAATAKENADVEASAADNDDDQAEVIQVEDPNSDRTTPLAPFTFTLFNMCFWKWLFPAPPQKQDGSESLEREPPPPYTPLPLQLPSRQPWRKAAKQPMLPPPTLPGAESAWPMPEECPFGGQSSCWILMEYFVPEGFTVPLEFESPEYLASLCVWAKDLPSLMKSGFHWDKKNVAPAGGFIDYKRPGKAWEDKKITSLSLNYVRYWILEDIGDDPQWIAAVSINAKKFSSLANFDLKKQLSPRNIIAAAARNPYKSWVYSYNRHFPEENFNAIYNEDVPMEGCWPPQSNTELD